ncbi:Axonemal dynein light chain [Plasmopara halstedii]|uniref:Axonemal dynein light chain n=1 Tax=Plasmopara halstedii TaxID=4781 RepID=A0A0P1AHX9_PLAHL|nr:Axonemal dynein light chain [Plasmopara halstedii]CEG40753.1 Axonemal dynein light chain [Plasmopara halstedii]|eukprot:XP_024577122.1 Axonemal dynein light chain [Plasmopara halstedii]
MSSPTPPESLVQYGEPIFTATVVAAAAEPAGSSANTEGVDGVTRVDDILNAILPPQMWSEEKSGSWLRYASSVPSTRFDVLKLQEALDAKILERQARDSGICPVREDLYSQAFNELIRQVTLNCPERGLLLLRIRDELRLTTDAYKTVYDSSVIFGVRKQLQAEEGMGDLTDQIVRLQSEKEESEIKVAELTNKLEVIEKRAAERKALQDKSFKEELDFLRYQGQHLEAFLKSAGSGMSSISAGGSK